MVKEERPTVTPLLACTDFRHTSRRAGMLHVLRGSFVPNGNPDGKLTRRTRFVGLVCVKVWRWNRWQKLDRDTLIGDRDP